MIFKFTLTQAFPVIFMVCQILEPLKLEQILHLAAHKQHVFCFCFVICYFTHAWYDTCWSGLISHADL